MKKNWNKSRDQTEVLILCFRLSLESHDEPGEAAILWGAGSSEQDPLGKISQLQVQAPAQEDLHHWRQKAAYRRVQADDAVATSGDEAVLCGVSVIAIPHSPWVFFLFFFRIYSKRRRIGTKLQFILHVVLKFNFKFAYFTQAGFSVGLNV